ncbi:hypothetical protein [Desulfovibrio cuneatus]|uniref:hypothetical protein n=1 Tax=Desulfovibrio cuneatus TaxID=159728 RepID=UPI000425F805|nr:hypothetical protein [Desulfovibrio cuneatus]
MYSTRIKDICSALDDLHGNVNPTGLELLQQAQRNLKSLEEELVAMEHTLPMGGAEEEKAA